MARAGSQHHRDHARPSDRVPAGDRGVHVAVDGYDRGRILAELAERLSPAEHEVVAAQLPERAEDLDADLGVHAA